MLIGIIGAMDEEITFLLDNIEDKQEITIANCLFVQGTLAQQNVVLLKSGIGKVNAAMATTIMCERFKPAFVINTGSAGGFAEELNIGDIVISDEVVHHDVDVTAFNYEYGQVPGMPVAFKADQQLIDRAEQIVARMDIQSKVGKIASGDAFISDPNRVALIHENITDIIAVEMEAAAVAQVCYQYQIPFVIIRALSDIAGKESSISFDQFLQQAAKNTTQFIIEMVK